MTIPLDHMKEELQYAYTSAVVARAGAIFTPPKRDYGTDGIIGEIQTLSDGKYLSTGRYIACQLKATTICSFEVDCVVYDMDVEAYNKFARWEGPTPYILILFRLPQNPQEWLVLDEEQLLLKKCCYWTQIFGSPSGNASSVRIRIPRTQTFTPDTVIELFEKLRAGEI
jgi:hypothetical protein